MTLIRINVLAFKQLDWLTLPLILRAPKMHSDIYYTVISVIDFESIVTVTTIKPLLEMKELFFSAVISYIKHFFFF